MTLPSTARDIEPAKAPNEAWRGSLLSFGFSIAVLLAGLGVSYGVAALQHREHVSQLRESLAAELAPIRGELSRQIFSAVHLTEGIASWVAVEGEPSPEKFQALAAELLSRSDIIQNIVVAPDNVVKHVYPLQGNEAVMGLRYADNPEQWPSVQRMIAENRLVVAGPVKLVQGGVGIVARRPIVRVDKTAPGGKRYWGLTSTVVNFDQLIARSQLPQATESLQLAMRGVDGTGATGPVFWGDASVFAKEPVIRDVTLPTGMWQLGAAPKNGWPVFSALRSNYFQFGATASLALSLLILMLLRVSRALRFKQMDLQHAYDNMETKVIERTHELSIAKTAAESADRLKSAFLATMSHELRTPLNSIIGFTGIVLQERAGPLTGEQRKQLGMVQGSARHLLALINDVLDISKIEAGELTIESQPFDLRASIDKVVAIVKPLAEKKQLALNVQMSDDVQAFTGDARRVEQVLINLVGNAIKFTDTGSVTLEASIATDVRLNDSAETCNAVRIRIADTGIGIKPDDMSLLFQPFRQVSTTLSRTHEGTGLGLAICRRLVHLMNGVITAESEWQKGSVFTVMLPLDQPSSKAGA
jgi:signal transduction histidine kinase